MNILNSICAALTIVFALALLVLLAQVFYVLWRRRRFRGLTLSSSSGVDFSGDSIYSTPSKELLYFFCWKNQAANRIEPDATAPTAPPLTPPPPPTDAEVEEMLKLQGMYGPSRVLFTIREEEREEMEADTLCSTETEARKETTTSNFSEADVPAAVIEVGEATTPFSTPCGSPPYFTPSPSPPRNGSWTYVLDDENDVVLGSNEGARSEQPRETAVSGDNTTASISIDVLHAT